jgi:hypothetical protein
MSVERHRRAERILDARQRALNIAEAELAELARKTVQACLAAERTRAELEVRMDAPPVAEWSSDELARERAYFVALARYADALATTARDAKAKEELSRTKVLGAKTEHKKVETWRDRLIDAHRLEEARIERVQSDELAARVARKA